jgi:methylated-DNA-[protein]-cysteine S-methyltransferase
MTIFTLITSPLGELLVTGDGTNISGLYLPLDGERPYGITLAADARRDDEAFAVLRAQLDEYFAGERRAFSVPIAAGGSPFQRRVWSALCEIDFGTTESYGQVARRLGEPTASRAVGTANSRNPICIIVPCHRVIGADGSLTGYAGGLANKKWLLTHEATVAMSDGLLLG